MCDLLEGCLATAAASEEEKGEGEASGSSSSGSSKKGKGGKGSNNSSLLTSSSSSSNFRNRGSGIAAPVCGWYDARARVAILNGGYAAWKRAFRNTPAGLIDMDE